MTDTSREFLETFNTLWNNINSNQAPGLDIYEVSLFLTQAQEEIVKNRFTPKGNRYQEGIDDSTKRQADFSTLIKVKNCDEASGNLDYFLHPSSVKFSLVDEDIFFILNEQCVCDGRYYLVVPIDHEEYDRLMQKPYKMPLKNQVWKLNIDYNTANNKGTIVELIGKFPEGKAVTYQVRYVRRPRPIILEDLEIIDPSLRIQKKHNESLCELPEHLYSEIIQRAVEIAKATWQGDLKTSIEMGNRKE